MKVLTYNAGCIREEIITKQLRERIVNEGHTKCYEIREADILIYITCGGTGDNINECLEDIGVFRRLKKESAKLIITGCLTKIDCLFEDLKKEDNIYIVKNTDFIVPIFNIINDEAKRNTIKTKLINRTRYPYDTNTFIQFFLCNGCINNCSFCKTQYLSEPLTSIPYDIAFNYLKSLVESGTKIIILSGENLTLYGIDLYGKPMLHKFIHDLCELPGLESLTINEVTAQNMYPELHQELITQPKVKTVGIQLETASNRLLKLMNRKHTLEEYDDIVLPLLKEGKLIDTVLMSGFPTETYDDLDKTINYLRERKIYTELICRYSDFPLIESSNLPQYKTSEKIKHTIYLREAINEVNKETLLHKINDTRESIVIGKIGRKVYLRNIFNGYTIKKEYQDAELGSKITIPANKVIHLSKSKIGYLYRH